MTKAFLGSSENLYNLYVKNVIALAKTIVIKFDQVAESTNNLALSKGDLFALTNQDKYSWKYYQNMSGVYNSTDKIMYIQSLDGNGEIVFSKQNLELNPSTKTAYVYGSYYYKELVARYPDQEALIFGIIYPCDIDTAINAKDGTILSYPSFLIEENETDFINKLQTWIYNHIDRWVIKGYTLTDDLYMACAVAQLTMNMIPAIMNIRLAACKTNQAHSYHVSQYLRSHGFIDFYLAELTREQALDFYRNIKYYERNSGFVNTFYTLIDLLLTKRQMPVYEYVFKQNDKSISNSQSSDLSNLYSRHNFDRLPLNTYAQTNQYNSYTLADVFGLINKAADKNKQWRDSHEQDTFDQFTRSKTAYLKTKIIEVGLPATQINSARTPEFIFLQEWFARVCSGEYQADITITPPKVNGEIQLSQKSALALWIFCINRAFAPKGDTNYPLLNIIPKILIDEACFTTLPQKSVVKYGISSLVDDIYFNEMFDLTVIPPQHITSVNAFKNYCGEVFRMDQAQYRLYSRQEDPRVRAQLEYVSNRLHRTYKASIMDLTGINYVDFFNQIGFNPNTYSGDEFFKLSELLFKEATGFDLDATDNPINIQKAMVALLKQLSSYSILLITNTDVVNTITATVATTRFFNFTTILENTAYIDTAPVTVLNSNLSLLSDVVFLDVDVLFPVGEFIIQLVNNVDYSLSQILGQEVVVSQKSIINHPTEVYVSVDSDPYSIFNSLTAEQKKTLVV